MKLKYIVPNRWYHKLYNTYSFYKLKRHEHLFTDDLTIASEETPIFITGFFRSGTSLFTQLIHAMGVDLGPQQHLLQAKNSRANWNPDGFFENYLFMEMSLYAFHKLDSWGHLPPTYANVKNLVFDQEDRKIFAEFTLCGVRDDRISNNNKIDVLKEYDLLALNEYLKHRFKAPYAIKNPHFAVLTPLLEKKWPNATYIVCFRQPMASIESAKKITPELTEEVYLKYYEQLLNLPTKKVLFVSYDALLQNPTKVLTAINTKLNLDSTTVQKACKLIKPNLNRYNTTDEPITQQVKDLYQQLLAKSIV